MQTAWARVLAVRFEIPWYRRASAGELLLLSIRCFIYQNKESVSYIQHQLAIYDFIPLDGWKDIVSIFIPRSSQLILVKFYIRLLYDLRCIFA